MKNHSNVVMAVIVSRLGWAVFAAVLGWLLLFLVTGEQFTLVRWMSYVAPWMAAMLLLCALAVFLLRMRRQAVVTAALAVLLLLPYMPRFLPSWQSDSIPQAGHQTIYKIMTYSKMGRNHDIDAVARVVASEKPDILIMQEISEAETQKLVHLLTGVYKQQLYFVNDHYGLILSRYKVVSRLKNGDAALPADIALPDGDIRVWDVHLQKSLGSSTAIQYGMVDELATHVASENGPVLVAGDFNATMINYPCVKMKQYLADAFEQAGFGFGFTFPSPARHMGMLTRFMRIDYIFFSHHFIARKAYVVNDAGGSDHYPVVALLSLENNTMTGVQ